MYGTQMMAARQLQRAWRLYKNPKGGGEAVVHTGRGSSSQQPRFVAFNKKKKAVTNSKMNDPGAAKKSR